MNMHIETKECIRFYSSEEYMLIYYIFSTVWTCIIAQFAFVCDYCFMYGTYHNLSFFQQSNYYEKTLLMHLIYDKILTNPNFTVYQ